MFLTRGGVFFVVMSVALRFCTLAPTATAYRRVSLFWNHPNRYYPAMAFEVRYSTKAATHLKKLRAVDRATILDEIEQVLTVNPSLTSKAKVKKLRQPAPTQFRLRVGELRVFYDINEEAKTVDVISNPQQRGLDSIPGEVP